MTQSTDIAPFVLKASEQTVTRDQILQAMAEFDETKRGTLPDTKGGWFVQEHERRYPPKWVLKLATNAFIGAFRGHEARETLRALGFDVRPVDPPEPPKYGENDEEPEENDGTTFGLERDLQNALRNNIEQLELGLTISDGGKEREVEFDNDDEVSGRIDITAEDTKGATVVIELKAGKAGRRAIEQIAAYMGVLIQSKKPIRGILVAEECSPQAIAAARVVPDLQLRKYSFRFAFGIVGAG
jgi:Endonuclease NucS